ncbi:hypothetical protein BJ684DRAFT_16266 [Piptocephalis cylindrospora]|uniref:Uncharacterized protein n=1 Tax=Piptocephalis cylindrospora TaxID=1907219 RepID=A0A4P9Y365_9FUNG|nr:hypothetical protein BJ684DRAFT_16266 [Piptocephalis cylindrospora]|eukprot:RKP13327.1 hypothetical protein BJ684DRAFT_16266 [Piptocephalis cylindrospora]
MIGPEREGGGIGANKGKKRRRVKEEEEWAGKAIGLAKGTDVCRRQGMRWNDGDRIARMCAGRDLGMAELAKSVCTGWEKGIGEVTMEEMEEEEAASTDIRARERQDDWLKRQAKAAAPLAPGYPESPTSWFSSPISLEGTGEDAGPNECDPAVPLRGYFASMETHSQALGLQRGRSWKAGSNDEVW